MVLWYFLCSYRSVDNPVGPYSSVDNPNGPYSSVNNSIGLYASVDNPIGPYTNSVGARHIGAIEKAAAL